MEGDALLVMDMTSRSSLLVDGILVNVLHARRHIIKGRLMGIIRQEVHNTMFFHTCLFRDAGVNG